MNHAGKIGVCPRVSGVGGMVSFQQRWMAGVQQRGLEVTFDLSDPALVAVLVVGGTRRLLDLVQVRRRGIPIVQRLDGMNWLHRQRKTSLRHYLRAEYGNLLLSLIRLRIAERIVYQSHFSKEWWERVRGPIPKPSRVVYNGVDLQQFSLGIAGDRSQECWRILMVEGSLMGGYELGLEVGLALGAGITRWVSANLPGKEARPVELVVAGRVLPNLEREMQSRGKVIAGDMPFSIQFIGVVDQAQIPALYRSAHIFYSADIHAACPNSVIEALACGTPVLAFNTGALPEMVTGEAGKIVPYGADAWKLQPPNVLELVAAGCEMIAQMDRYYLAARARAEACFSLERMVNGYLEALLG